MSAIDGSINLGNSQLTILQQSGDDHLQVTVKDKATGQSTIIETTWADLVMKASSEGKDSLVKLLGTPVTVLPGEAARVSAALANLDGEQVNADIYAFMALFQKLAQQMRDTARTQRTTEMQSQVGALMNAADKMRDAAEKRFAAAVVQGAFQIASGALQMGMSIASVASSIKGASLTEQGNTKAFAGTQGKDQAMYAEGQALIKKGANWSSTGAGLESGGRSGGQMLGGVGSIISAGIEREAALDDVAAKKLETQAKVHETAVQHANDMMQQMMDVIRDVRDKLQSIQQAAIETNRGIARNI